MHVNVSITGLNKWYLAIYTVFTPLFILEVTNGQNCLDTVGSLYYNNLSMIIPLGKTFLLTDKEYTFSCQKVLIAWEFCYQVQGIKSPVSFTASIWRTVGSEDSDNYTQVHSHNISFIPKSINNLRSSCQRVNLSSGDQFIVPVGSVVGLYTILSDWAPLLKSSSNMKIFTFEGKHTNVNISDGRVANYSIAIKLHLG